MGKKVNPKIIRLNTTTTHLSRWFAPKRDFAKILQQDIRVRKYIRTKLRDGGVSRVEIRRANDQMNIHIRTSKPGVIIGRSGAGVEELKRQIKRQFFGSEKMKIFIEIEEVRNPDIDAELIMQGIVFQLEKRIPFRRAMKRAIEQVMQGGAKGVKIIVSGRLNGAEIARVETLSQGSVPTHTLRADIDYSRGVAKTIYGTIGVKVWIYRGQVFGKELPKEEVQPKKPVRDHHPEKGKRVAGRSKRTVVKHK
ncbi:MAG: 30S ribosomal protein S3 [uncultured bacterium]|nr:MAG: 30S ribosomal protein S3 [uncultured bacterium]HBY73236.1 30S ribosomal protein S3 [Candidatus Kerfeldbacteria bacterium]